jgi:hypothetical protein
MNEMDDLDILRECDDPVVNWIANHNEGYIILDILDACEAYVAYWSSWRGWGRLMLENLIVFFLMSGLMFLAKGLS